MTQHLQAWAAFIIFMYLKLLSNSLIQGREKMRTATFEYPEDQRLFAKNKPRGEPTDGLKRANNLWRNDLENIIPFSLVGLAAALVQVSFQILATALALYALSRILHAIFLMTGKQPHRNLSYQLGQLCTIVLMGAIGLSIYHSLSV